MKSLETLMDIVKTLRSPGGCPWDIEQTFESLKPHIIEEAYELSDAMGREDMVDLREELGDVLLHVVMLSRMAEETGSFSLTDVMDDVSEKMIRRHPHVFGEKKADSVEDVWKNWEAVKKSEKKDAGLFESIPKSLPALMKAYKVQKRVARQGFDWGDEASGPLDKLDEEIGELKEAIANESAERQEEEFGDVLFSCINVARKIGCEPETTLSNATQKFMDRYELMQQLMGQDGQTQSDLSLEEMEHYWQAAKKASLSQ